MPKLRAMMALYATSLVSILTLPAFGLLLAASLGFTATDHALLPPMLAGTVTYMSAASLVFGALLLLPGALHGVTRGYALLNIHLPGVLAWLRQTSTIIGIAGVAGVVMAYLGGSLTADQAVQALVPAIVALVMPGHGDAADAVTKATADAILLSHATTRVAAVENLVHDAPAAAAAMRGASLGVTNG